jgi:hypothetical protein
MCFGHLAKLAVKSYMFRCDSIGSMFPFFPHRVVNLRSCFRLRHGIQFPVHVLTEARFQRSRPFGTLPRAIRVSCRQLASLGLATGGSRTVTNT